MPTSGDLINSIVEIKTNSSELSQMIMLSCSNVDNNRNKIALVVSDLAKGRDAVAALEMASKALRDTSAKLNTLSRTCDEYLNNLKSGL